MSEKNISEMPNENIRKNLEIILKAAQENYDQITYKRRALQHSILRNYLWLATALFGVQMTLFYNMISGNAHFPWPLNPSICFYLFSLMMLLFSGGTFTFGIYAMIGKDQIMPYDSNYDRLVRNALAEAGQKASDCSTIIIMIKSLVEAILLHQQIASTTGKRLRKMAFGLLISIGLTVMAILFAFINFDATSSKKEVRNEMSNNQSSAQPQGKAAPNSQAGKPVNNSGTGNLGALWSQPEPPQSRLAMDGKPGRKTGK